MTCGEGLQCNHNRRYLVLLEIVLGLASAMQDTGVELLNGFEGLPGYSVQSNSEYRVRSAGSKSTGDNVRGQKGNNPDHLIRPLNDTQLLR